MASLKEQAAIAGRCRRIGWPVQASDGQEWLYKITRPTGRHVYLHQSPSDGNWVQIVIKQLNGRDKLFDKAEAAWKADHEQARLEKLVADKVANAKTLADAVKHAKQQEAAINRAAGPHAVVEFDPAWLLTPHELPEIRRGILTPELAAKLLDTIDRTAENRHQRKYRQAHEQDFVDIINDGDWSVTHQGMAVDTLGRLQDGQHRAGAVRTTGKPQEVYITVGMPPENFTKLDSPLQRTARDALDIRGETQVSALTSAARLIIAFDRDGAQLGTRNHGRHKITTAAVDRFVQGPEGPHLRDAVHRCTEIRHEIKIMASALTAGLFLIGRAAGADSLRVVRFFEDLETGIGITKTDVVYRLRRIFNENQWGRSGQYVSLALIIKSWNARAVDKQVKHLSWRSDEWFPDTIIVPAPEDDA